VKRQFTIRHLLAALAMLGLLLAQLSTPAIAMSMEMAAANIESTSADMPEGMPCCPDEPAKPDCAKNCPFMAVCAGMAFPAMNGATLSAPMALLAVIIPGSDAKRNGLAHGPPARPPKA